MSTVFAVHVTGAERFAQERYVSSSLYFVHVTDAYIIHDECS